MLGKFKISLTNLDSLNRKSIAAISGFRELLQKLFSQNGWKTKSVLQFAQNGNANQYYVRVGRNFWFSQWSSQWRLPRRTETTHSRKATRLNEGCQLQKSWVCPHDWRKSRSENTVKAENVRPRGVSLKNFLPYTTQKVHILKKKFWQSTWPFSSLHTFCGKQQSQQFSWQTTSPSLVFFQTKAIPPALWNACDYVLQFNFKKAHIAGSINTAADFLSRLEPKVTEKIRPKIREDIQTTPIEVTTSSSDVVDEEHFFFTQGDHNDESEEQTLDRKDQSRQNAKQWAANGESSALKTSVKEFTKIDGNTTSYSMNGIKANARIRVEQDVDFVLKNMKLKFLGQPYDEVLMITDSRYKNYKANVDLINLKDVQKIFRRNR